MKNGTKWYGSSLRICLVAMISALLTAMVSVNGPVSVAMAQTAETQYESIPFADQFKDPSSEGINLKDRAAASSYNEQRRAMIDKRRKTQTKVTDLLKGRSSQISTTEMDAWFTGYVIPLMAQTDEVSLSQLGKNRQNFFRFYLNIANNNQLRNRLIDLVIPPMKQIAEGNYHPACRVNAVVVLSQLNSRDGSRSSNQLPVPHAPTLAYLRTIVQQDTFPGYLKASALAGVERHAAVRGPFTNQAFSEQDAREIDAEMLPLIAADPSETDPDLDMWMKQRAIRVVGFVGHPGEKGEVAKALRDIIFDDDIGTETRMLGVSSYGLLNFTGKQDDAQVKTVATKIGELIALSAEEEAAFIDKKISDIKMTVKFLDGKDAVAETGGRNQRRGKVGLGQGADGGGPGQDVGKKNEFPEVLPVYQRELVRRRIKNNAWVTRVALVGNPRYGVRGLKSWADSSTDESELIDKLVKDIDFLMKAADVKEPEVKDDDDEKKKKKKKDKDKDDDDDEEEEKRTMSYADELKEAMVNGAKVIQTTLESYQPEKAAEAPAANSGGQNSSTPAG